jgi:hypothetical protein
MRLHTKLYYQTKEREKLDDQKVDRKKISKTDVKGMKYVA